MEASGRCGRYIRVNQHQRFVGHNGQIGAPPSGPSLITMIIAFDGNVFSGKTCFIESLRALHAVTVISEHSHFLDDARLIEDDWSTHMEYIEAETRRVNCLPDTVAGRPILLDRSLVSMAAHVSALFTTRSIDLRGRCLDELLARIQSKRVILPDKFCFVVCDYAILQDRALKDTAKRTDRFYYDNGYLEAIDAFNHAWQRHFSGIVIDTSTDDSVRLAQQELTRQLAACVSSGDVVRDISRWLTDMLT